MKDFVVFMNKKRCTVSRLPGSQLKRRNVNVLRQSDFANSARNKLVWNAKNMNKKSSFVKRHSRMRQKQNA